MGLGGAVYMQLTGNLLVYNSTFYQNKIKLDNLLSTSQVGTQIALGALVGSKNVTATITGCEFDTVCPLAEEASDWEDASHDRRGDDDHADDYGEDASTLDMAATVSALGWPERTDPTAHLDYRFKYGDEDLRRLHDLATDGALAEGEGGRIAGGSTTQAGGRSLKCWDIFMLGGSMVLDNTYVKGAKGSDLTVLVFGSPAEKEDDGDGVLHLGDTVDTSTVVRLRRHIPDDLSLWIVTSVVDVQTCDKTVALKNLYLLNSTLAVNADVNVTEMMFLSGASLVRLDKSPARLNSLYRPRWDMHVGGGRGDELASSYAELEAELGYTAPHDEYFQTTRCSAKSNVLPLVRAQAQFSMGQDQTQETITGALQHDLSMGAVGSQYNLRSVLDLLLGTIFIQNGRPIKIHEAVLQLAPVPGSPAISAESWVTQLQLDGHSNFEVNQGAEITLNDQLLVQTSDESAALTVQGVLNLPAFSESTQKKLAFDTQNPSLLGTHLYVNGSVALAEQGVLVIGLLSNELRARPYVFAREVKYFRGMIDVRSAIGNHTIEYKGSGGHGKTPTTNWTIGRFVRGGFDRIANGTNVLGPDGVHLKVLFARGPPLQTPPGGSTDEAVLAVEGLECEVLLQYKSWGSTNPDSTDYNFGPSNCSACLDTNSSCKYCEGGDQCVFKGSDGEATCAPKGNGQRWFKKTCGEFDWHDHGHCKTEAHQVKCVCEFWWEGDTCKDLSKNGIIVIVSIMLALWAILYGVGYYWYWQNVFERQETEYAAAVDSTITSTLHQLRSQLLTGNGSGDGRDNLDSSGVGNSAARRLTTAGWVEGMKQELVLRDVLVPFENLKLENQIGEGSVGVVYKAVYRSAAVALKLIKTPQYMELDEQELERFRAEAYLMSRLRHPNIVMIMGITVFDSQRHSIPASAGTFEAGFRLSDNTIGILSEYLNCGSLADVLYNNDAIDNDASNAAGGGVGGLVVGTGLANSGGRAAGEAEQRSVRSAVTSTSSSETALRCPDVFDDNVPLLNPTTGVVVVGGGGIGGGGDNGLLLPRLGSKSDEDVLTGLATVEWTYDLVLRCALQAARGMLFLHAQASPICHRDIKSSNLLVDDHWVVKVTDFGMSRILPESDPYITQAPVDLATTFHNSLKEQRRQRSDSPPKASAVKKPLAAPTPVRSGPDAIGSAVEGRPSLSLDSALGDSFAPHRVPSGLPRSPDQRGSGVALEVAGDDVPLPPAPTPSPPPTAQWLTPPPHVAVSEGRASGASGGGLLETRAVDSGATGDRPSTPPSTHSTRLSQQGAPLTQSTRPSQRGGGSGGGPSDSGAGRHPRDDLMLTSNVGTVAWAAPEVFAGERAYTSYSLKVDVYSFGMVLYELMERKPPFNHLTSRFDIMDLVAQGKRPETTVEIPDSYRELMEKCWQQDPMRRPDFQTIVSSLEDLCLREKEAQKARQRQQSVAGYNAFSPGSFGGVGLGGGHGYGYGVTPPTPGFGPYGPPHMQGGLLPPRFGSGNRNVSVNESGSGDHVAGSGPGLQGRGGSGGPSQGQGQSRFSPFGGPLAGWRNRGGRQTSRTDSPGLSIPFLGRWGQGRGRVDSDEPDPDSPRLHAMSF